MLSLPIKESHGGPIAADILAKLGDWDLLLGTSGGRSQAEQHRGHADYRQQGEMFPAKSWCPHDDGKCGDRDHFSWLVSFDPQVTLCLVAPANWIKTPVSSDGSR